jgi:hypothetical protein
VKTNDFRRIGASRIAVWSWARRYSLEIFIRYDALRVNIAINIPLA